VSLVQHQLVGAISRHFSLSVESLPFVFIEDFNMSTTIPSSITGTNVASLSSAVFTVVGGAAPDNNAKRGILSALASGTAANVRFHSVSDPFDFTVWAPKQPKALPTALPTGVYPPIPSNDHAVVFRKGVRPATGVQSIATAQLKTSVPAGSESNDSANIAAMYSAIIGYCNAKIADLYDNALTGSV
jgi:hypothetical protein